MSKPKHDPVEQFAAKQNCTVAGNSWRTASADNRLSTAMLLGARERPGCAVKSSRVMDLMGKVSTGAPCIARLASAATTNRGIVMAVRLVLRSMLKAFSVSSPFDSACFTGLDPGHCETFDLYFVRMDCNY